MKYYVFQGDAVNVASSLIKFREGKSGYFIWGFHGNDKRLERDYCDIDRGDYAFLYVTRPVSAMVLGGFVREKYVSNERFWPIDYEKNDYRDYWPLRVKIEVEYLCVEKNNTQVWDNIEGCAGGSREKCEAWGQYYQNFRKDLPYKPFSGSIKPIDENTYNELHRFLEERCIKIGGGSAGSVGEVSCVDLLETFNRLVNGSDPYGHLKALMLIHLVAGKNVIVIGPPGSGKTTMVKRFCDDVGVKYDLYTGNPEWTSFDTIGGVTVRGEFRPGFVTNAIIRSWREIRSFGRPVFLIIDELNRANVDLAFVQFFTLLDVEHRRDTPLLRGDELPERFKDVLIEDGLFVPFSFRVLATMNSYDRALLFKLGYALLRRFAIVEMRRDLKFEEGSNNINKIREFINEKKFNPNCDLKESINRQIIENSLKLSREGQGDFAVIDRTIHSTLKDKSLDDVLKVGDLDLYDLLLSIVCIINNRLHDFGVEVTEGPASDAIKFLVAALLLDGDWALKHVVSLIDEAIASYVIPQLGVLVNRVRAEKMGIEVIEGKGEKISDALNALSKEFRDMGLRRTSELFERLARGEDVP
ncbi:hypothetical protein B7L70_02235 [Vulcanisaeta sp. EB80]|uniref:AAA family ATPase n=1 Tax=Vulcanisaeta sp. EB80 TaxID=1650660 RepID=UPI0009BF681B|nr:AAA family ATPase [Vulcanisaeta sp. EB80]PLC68691.1 hypothetical protein B7L70_02235 [Vulcanisaeta sp. EB80]